MKALIRFSFGSLIYDPGDNVELPEDDLNTLQQQGLVGDDDDEKEEIDDEGEKRVIHKPGKPKGKK